MKDIYKVSRFTIWVDKLLSRLISFVGIFLISAILGILLFIFLQVLPLLKEAKIEKSRSFVLESKLLRSPYFIVDEWGETPSFISKEGIYYFNQQKKLVKLKKFPLLKEEKVKLLRYYDLTNTIAIVTQQNRVVVVKVNFTKSLREGGQISLSLENRFSYQLPKQENFKKLDFVINDNYCFLITYGFENKKKLNLYYFQNNEKDELFGASNYSFHLADSQSLKLRNSLTHTLIDSYARNIVLIENGQSASYYSYTNKKMEFIQNFDLFSDKAFLKEVGFILGDKTFIAISNKGQVKGFSLAKKENHKTQKFFLTKDKFKDLTTKKDIQDSYFTFVRSHRNKSFLLTLDQDLFLNYSTTQTQKLKYSFDSPIILTALNKKYDKIFVILDNGTLFTYDLSDPHPEGSFASFFGKIWYEGESEPNYKWESSGSGNEFEPKLSMLPLIFGTLKATFYSMLFAVPLAFLAALFTAEFLPYRIKVFIKPLIELMASLPSVVVGFLGALWLAPRIYDKIPLLILLCIFVPTACISLMFILFKVFKSSQTREKVGAYSFALFIPLILLVYQFCSSISPWFERTFFTFIDSSGYKTTDFISWWTNGVGLSYTNLNSLVVGISMGFAVVPIIYTIIEDSIFSVPKSIKSASIALGASKWQTIFRVTLPMASVWILSAVMIGFGRAVGETMIVLFCAGGTALTEFNIFSGMRTLSVNLATELPEADYGGTLFRTLYLGALILFLMTFVINFLAEIFKQYMKKKYKNL